MKNALDLILLINTTYVFIISENPNLIVFFLPALIYVIFVFLRIYHKEFTHYLNTPTKDEKNS